MEIEELIEEVITAGVKAYRKNYRNCPEGIRLMRKEPVILQGIEFNCWREYAVYKMGQYIQEVCPEVNVHIELDGNESTLTAEVSDEENSKLVETLEAFYNKWLS